MRKYCLLGLAGLLVLFAAVVFPVSAMVHIDNTTVATTTVPIQITPGSEAEINTNHIATIGSTGITSTLKPTVNAIVSPAAPFIGDTVTVSGLETGGNISSGIWIWIFAGLYVNGSLVSVNADGSFSKTYPTADLLPAKYYVIVQNPGEDGRFDITLKSAGGSSVVTNAETGAVLFNFTGTESVQDAVAAQDLINATSATGKDDVSTELTFQLTAPATTVPTSQIIAITPDLSTTPAPGSSLPAGITVIALAIATIGAMKWRKAD
jgi:hypothetical protein